MYSGYLEVDTNLQNNIQYWFTESDNGSQTTATPLIMWMNGGPGASSSIGLLAENIGLYSIEAGGKLNLNANSWTKFAHVIIFDNPVGSGYSYTSTGSQVTSEEQMAQQLTKAILMFFNKHPEYKDNQLWIAGESQAGKQIPNLAQQIMKQKKVEINLAGVIMGNGLYDAKIQYNSIAEYALQHGLIDENKQNQIQKDVSKCTSMIDSNELKDAAIFCESIVTDIYDNTTGAFRQDIKQQSNVLGDLDAKIKAWIQNKDVQTALHVKPDAEWQDSDETGPVADNLRQDFMTSVMNKLEYLLDSGLPVLMYNGERDGSACNHIGNMRVAQNLDWKHKDGFNQAKNKNLKMDDGKMVGFIKQYKNFSYLTVVNTGHLVPMFVPEESAQFVNQFINGKL